MSLDFIFVREYANVIITFMILVTIKSIQKKLNLPQKQVQTDYPDYTSMPASHEYRVRSRSFPVNKR